MNYDEFHECLDDLTAMFGMPADAEKTIGLWWHTGQCKDYRCWRKATDMIIEQREFKSFPTLGDFMRYYTSAYNAIKYNREPTPPVDSDMVEIRRIDNEIYDLSEEEKQRLREAAKEHVSKEQEEKLKGFEDLKPTVKDYISRKDPGDGFKPVGVLLCLSPILTRARVQQVMRDLYREGS